jgi:hypothetical protein
LERSYVQRERTKKVNNDITSGHFVFVTALHGGIRAANILHSNKIMSEAKFWSDNPFVVLCSAAIELSESLRQTGL